MGQTDKGVLIFGEWFEAMNMLSPKDYKSLMNAIYRYQLLGEEPPEFKGKAGMMSSVIFPYIKRRLATARAGKKGSSARFGKYGINPIIDEILDSRADNRADSRADG